jgi:hypothetical protein
MTIDRLLQAIVATVRVAAIHKCYPTIPAAT